MRDFEDLIRYENENTSVDFKKKQYSKETHVDLLKDVMSMANADVDGPRFLVLGVKDQHGKKREFPGISKNEFLDASIYQQAIDNNIEPSLSIQYLPFEMASKLFGILVIDGCNDKPYMMKKDYKALRRGDSLIRKGTKQEPLLRHDLNKIVAQQSTRPIFDDKVEVHLVDEDKRETSSILTINASKIPSNIARQELEKEIRKKIQLQGKLTVTFPPLPGMENLPPNNYLGIHYSKKSLEELEQMLDGIDEDFGAEDYYNLFEVQGSKVNFVIKNVSDCYLEDATFKLTIPALPGIIVASSIPHKPTKKRHIWDTAIDFDALNVGDSIHYPHVEAQKDSFIVVSDVGNVKHHLATMAFREPLRIAIAESFIDEEIEIEAEILGKNLSKPLSFTFKLEGIAPKSQDNTEVLYLSNEVG